MVADEPLEVLLVKPVPLIELQRNQPVFSMLELAGVILVQVLILSHFWENLFDVKPMNPSQRDSTLGLVNEFILDD